MCQYARLRADTTFRRREQTGVIRTCVFPAGTIVYCAGARVIPVENHDYYRRDIFVEDLIPISPLEMLAMAAE